MNTQEVPDAEPLRSVATSTQSAAETIPSMIYTPPDHALPLDGGGPGLPPSGNWRAAEDS